jgi:hypothetical protein
MKPAMARHGTALNVGAVCIALALLTPSSSFGGEPTNCPEWSGAGCRLSAQSASAPGLENKWLTAPADATSGYDQGPLANGRLAQASNCDVVTCTYVTKTVICHRIAHSCPPQLLPFRNLPQKQTVSRRPFPDLERCRRFRNYQLQSGRFRRVCVQPK